MKVAAFEVCGQLEEFIVLVRLVVACIPPDEKAMKVLVEKLIVRSLKVILFLSEFHCT